MRQCVFVIVLLGLSGVVQAAPTTQKFWIVRAILACKACEQDGMTLIAGNKPAQYMTAKSQCEAERTRLVDAVKKTVKNKTLKIKAKCEETKNPAAVEAE
jgi:hypothetical protein